jgi:hypothetical protein
MNRERVVAEAHATLERLQGLKVRDAGLPQDDAVESWRRLREQSEPQREPPMSEDASDEVIYRSQPVFTPREATPAPASPASPFVDSNGELPSWLVDVFGEVLASERQRARRERQEELGPLRDQISELRGQVAALIAIIGNTGSSKAAIVSLSRRSDAA